jgi:hypothetical protein
MVVRKGTPDRVSNGRASQSIWQWMTSNSLARAAMVSSSTACTATGSVRWPAETKGVGPYRLQLGARLRITAGEQGDVVPKLDQFVDQPRHDAFGAAVELGRNALGQGGDLGNAHRRCRYGRR